jgi:hypothetical protein
MAGKEFVAFILALVVFSGPVSLAQLGMTVHADGHCDDIICMCPAKCLDHRDRHGGGHDAHTASMHPGAVSTQDELCATADNCGFRAHDALVPAPALKGVVAPAKLVNPARGTRRPDAWSAPAVARVDLTPHGPPPRV